MQRSKRIERERRLAVERSIKYWGTVSVNINILEFPNDKDEESIDKLVELFKNDYRTLNPRYHIPAKIEKHQLDAALQLSGLTLQKLKEPPDNLRGYPELKFPVGFRLKCCQGLHRSQAAARILPPGEQCWSIDLYDSDIHPDLDVELSEGYSAEKKLNDGVVYHKIRKYQGHHGPANPFFETRWWALLEYHSEKKMQNLRTILAPKSIWKAAFDIQLDIPALADGMELGVMHKVFTMRIDEASHISGTLNADTNIAKLALEYLGNIEVAWKDGICGKDPEMMQKIDRLTIKAVEHTAPGCCKKDRDDLWKRLKSGEIFTAFLEEERQLIWTRLLEVSTTRFIPSLFTFFEDVNYLEGPLQSLKRLVPVSRNETISSALVRAYKDINQDPDQVIIQESESIITFIPGTKVNRLELGVRQAWMCAMRTFTDIPPIRKKRENVRRANPAYKESPKAVHNLASLLFRLGFQTDQILEAIHHSADSVIAHNALLEARPPDQFAYDSFAQCKIQMMDLFTRARELSTEDIISAVELDNYVEFPTRCGKPSEAERKQTKPLLFADRLHRQEDSETVTPFLVRKSVYLTFLGKPEFNHVGILPNRREQLENRRTEQRSTFLAQERQLEEAWQELEKAKKSLSQELEDERKRLADKLEQFTQKYENQVKANERDFISKFNEQWKKNEANLKFNFDQKEGETQKYFNIKFDEWLKIKAEFEQRQRQLEEDNKTLEAMVKQKTDQEVQIRKRTEEQEDLGRKTQQLLEVEKRKFEEQLQELGREKEEICLRQEGEITELKEKLRQLGEGTEKLRETEQQLKQQAQQLWDDNKGLNEQVQQLRVQKEKSQRDAEQQLNKDKSVNAEIKMLQEQCRALKGRLEEERSSGLTEARLVQEEKDKGRIEAQQREAELEKQIYGLDQQLKELLETKNQLTEMEGANRHYQGEIKELREKCQALEEQLQKESAKQADEDEKRKMQKFDPQLLTQAKELSAKGQASRATRASGKRLNTAKAKGIGYARRRATEIKLQNSSHFRDLEKNDSIAFIIEKGVGVGDEPDKEIVAAAEVKQKAEEYKTKQYDIYNSKGRQLDPENCYESVTEDSSRTIIIRPRTRKRRRE